MTNKKMNKKGIATIYVVIFIIVLLVFVGYAYWDNYQRNIKISLTPTQTKNTTTITTVNSSIKITSTTYPNVNLTPGAILTMDSGFICTPGTAEKLRNVPDSLKKKVFAEYNLAYPTKKDYEVDHFIPLELGGSNDIKNLWPESASPVPGYHEKNKVENYLHKLLCNYTINMSTAQEMIRKDWVAVYNQCCAK